MDKETIGFGSLLKTHLKQAAMGAERTMSLIQQRFPEIPEWKDQDEKKRCVSAIENWLHRSIKKPRPEQWPLLVAIAAVLQLKVDETERLLQAAGLKTLGNLLQGASEMYQELFVIWMKPVFAEEMQEDLTEMKNGLGEQGGLIKEIHTHVLSVKSDHLEGEKPIWMVPFARNPYFTGRDDLLSLLNQQLSPADNADPVTISRAALTQPQAIKGLGGIGKTQIAVEYAYRARELKHYTHTFWINAASEEALLTDFIQIAELLPDFPAKGETDQRKLVEAVKSWLEQCKECWLLIFDNADDVALVHDYLPKLGNGSILLTTRASAIGSLATSVEVETMGFSEGTELLLRRAQRFEHVSDEEINQAGNIVVALDHFPLALDQAGAYLEETQCSFDEYLDLYQTHRQDLLARRGISATDYPYSVATTWLLSFQKVQQGNPAAAELLQLCSFLAPDRIPEELLRESAVHWPPLLQKAVADSFAFQQMVTDLLKFSLVKRLVKDRVLSIHRLVQTVQMDMMDMEIQRQWAERVIRAVDKVFPNNPKNTATWPQCLRYLDQVQTCNFLIERYILPLTLSKNAVRRPFYLFTIVYQWIKRVSRVFLGNFWIKPLPLIEAAHLLNRAGVYLGEHALYSLAEPLLKRVLEICERHLGTEHPDTARGVNNLAGLYEKQGKFEEAEPLLKRVLEICERHLGTEHPDTATSMNNLAMLYGNQGRYEEAEPLYKRALEICEWHLGTEHPDTATSMNNLAVLYENQGRYKEAEQLYKRALEICERHLEEEHPDTATSMNNLAMLYESQERYEEAEPLYKRALEIFEKQFGAEHPDTKAVQENYTRILTNNKARERGDVN